MDMELEKKKLVHDITNVINQSIINHIHLLELAYNVEVESISINFTEEEIKVTTDYGFDNDTLEEIILNQGADEEEVH